MARIRCRRHAPLLCAAAARSRADQDAAQSDHRGQHRLALLQRAETRAEGVNMYRRSFLTGMAGASAAPLFPPNLARAAEAAPETTRISLAKTAALCTAPQYIAEELLRAEGFTEIRFVDATAPEIVHGVGSGKFDMAAAYASQFVSGIEAGEPVTLLAGIMVGCFELFGSDAVRS